VEVKPEHGCFKKSVKSEQGECFLNIYLKKGLIFSGALAKPVNILNAREI